MNLHFIFTASTQSRLKVNKRYDNPMSVTRQMLQISAFFQPQIRNIENIAKKREVNELIFYSWKIKDNRIAN